MTLHNYIIHGAGGIGSVIAARLASAGKRVQLVARGGAHLQALQRQGAETYSEHCRNMGSSS